MRERYRRSQELDTQNRNNHRRKFSQFANIHVQQTQPHRATGDALAVKWHTQSRRHAQPEPVVGKSHLNGALGFGIKRIDHQSSREPIHVDDLTEPNLPNYFFFCAAARCWLTFMASSMRCWNLDLVTGFLRFSAICACNLVSSTVLRITHCWPNVIMLLTK